MEIEYVTPDSERRFPELLELLRVDGGFDEDQIQQREWSTRKLF